MGLVFFEQYLVLSLTNLWSYAPRLARYARITGDRPGAWGRGSPLDRSEPSLWRSSTTRSGTHAFDVGNVRAGGAFDALSEGFGSRA